MYKYSKVKNREKWSKKIKNEEIKDLLPDPHIIDFAIMNSRFCSMLPFASVVPIAGIKYNVCIKEGQAGVHRKGNKGQNMQNKGLTNK